MEHITVGDLVRAKYKSGEYIGEVVLQGDQKWKVKVLAVIKHPEQGNLHRPMDPNVRMFHQRRALAHREIFLAPIEDIQPFEGEIPDYKDSLQLALDTEIEAMEQFIMYEAGEIDSKTVDWAKASLAQLMDLKEDYQL